MNRKVWKSGISISLILLWFVVGVMIIKGYETYQYQEQHPQTRYEADYSCNYPAELYVKQEKVKEIRHLITYAVILVGLNVLFKYKHDPENHWLTFFIDSIKRIEESGGEK